MTTKDYLNQINRLDKTIQNKLSELLQYRELSISLSAVSSDIKVRTSSEVDRIGRSIARLDELEQQLDRMIDCFVDKKHISLRRLTLLRMRCIIRCCLPGT